LSRTLSLNDKNVNAYIFKTKRFLMALMVASQ